METETRGAGNLLCICNFPANTGFAWTFFETLFAGVAARVGAGGIRTFVAHPRIEEPPHSLAGTDAESVLLELNLKTWSSVRRVGAFIRDHEVRSLFMFDRPVWHPAYAYLRWCGLRRIIVYDQTSGVRTRPRGAWRLLKRATRPLPGFLATDVLAVSDYVARRKVEVDLLREHRVERVWNSIDIESLPRRSDSKLRSEFGISAERPIIAAGCRATPEKGVQHLLVAFDAVHRSELLKGPRPVLVFLGDGPMLEELSSIRDGLESHPDMIFGGYRSDLLPLIAGADVCVVPSTWQEGFGLAALEPMALGLPVIASTAGGIPEVVRDGETGLLVEPADEIALEGALLKLLNDPELRDRLGRAGVQRARDYFSRDEQLATLTDVVMRGFRADRSRSPKQRQQP